MLTKEQVEEKYKDTILMFDYYYKFTFYFSGTADDGSYITASFGGDSSDIYRTEVSSGEERDLEYVDEWNSVQIKKDGEVIFDHYDW